jgi:hypothetical protein
MLAQSLVEYSAVATITETFHRAAYSVEAYLASLSTREWAVIGGVVIVGLLLRGRGRAR